MTTKTLSTQYLGLKVRVYRNLRNGLLSVQTKINRSWIVAGHVNSILLSDVTFNVSQAGRERVIKNKRKNVHAFVYGTLVEIETGDTFPVAVKYNPYKYTSFVVNDSPIFAAKVAVVSTSGISIN
jgi:hypothetical protein